MVQRNFDDFDFGTDVFDLLLNIRDLRSHLSELDRFSTTYFLGLLERQSRKSAPAVGSRNRAWHNASQRLYSS